MMNSSILKTLAVTTLSLSALYACDKDELRMEWQKEQDARVIPYPDPASPVSIASSPAFSEATAAPGESVEAPPLDLGLGRCTVDMNEVVFPHNGDIETSDDEVEEDRNDHG